MCMQKNQKGGLSNDAKQEIRNSLRGCHDNVLACINQHKGFLSYIFGYQCKLTPFPLKKIFDKNHVSEITFWGWSPHLNNLMFHYQLERKMTPQATIALKKVVTYTSKTTFVNPRTIKIVRARGEKWLALILIENEQN